MRCWDESKFRIEDSGLRNFRLIIGVPLNPQFSILNSAYI